MHDPGHDPGANARTLRPFVPSQDFESSKAFYELIGFRKGFDNGKIALMSLGSCAFLLQNYYNKDWAENCMLQILVRDLDAWWRHVGSLDLPSRHGVRPPAAPREEPWGMRVAYLWDPSGVLWHVACDAP